MDTPLDNLEYPNDQVTGTEWVVNREMTGDQIDMGSFLASKGAELQEKGAIDLEDEEVEPGSEINTTVRYEKSPHSNEIHIRMEWGDEQTEYGN